MWKIFFRLHYLTNSRQFNLTFPLSSTQILQLEKSQTIKFFVQISLIFSLKTFFQEKIKELQTKRKKILVPLRMLWYVNSQNRKLSLTFLISSAKTFTIMFLYIASGQSASRQTRLRKGLFNSTKTARTVLCYNNQEMLEELQTNQSIIG